MSMENTTQDIDQIESKNIKNTELDCTTEDEKADVVPVNPGPGEVDDNFDDDFGDFADFQEAQVDQGDQFAAFVTSEKTEAAVDCAPSFKASSAPIVNQVDSDVTAIIRDTFPLINQRLDEETSVSSDLFQGRPTHSRNLWENLLNQDKTSSLKLNWKSSHTFQVFLDALKIRPQPEITFDNCVPNFASGLGLLEPNKSSSPSSLNSSSGVETVSLDIKETHNNKPETSRFSTPTTNSNLSPSTSSVHTEEKPSPQNALDLDFFFINSSNSPKSSSKNVSKISSLEAELLQEDRCPLKPLSIISSSSTDPLHQLISQIHNSSNISPVSQKRPTDLSSEANQILEELPILNFMRSKVLMFPVQDRTKE
ncbi:aftiphilin-like [Brevipalpus obovatus]|uniref:aftiphilin-like n=1 Tax=Brevipalpus obovatus TaxID=246614 RepID=UPI003D9F44EF